MAKEKLTISDLKIQSVVTALDGEQMNQLKGGVAVVRGRNHTYTTRWTAIDTRVEPTLHAAPKTGG